MVLGNPFPVLFHPSLRNYLFRSIRRQIPKVWRGSVSLIGTHGFAKRRLYSLAPSFHLAIYICLTHRSIFPNIAKGGYVDLQKPPFRLQSSMTKISRFIFTIAQTAYLKVRTSCSDSLKQRPRTFSSPERVPFFRFGTNFPALGRRLEPLCRGANLKVVKRSLKPS